VAGQKAEIAVPDQHSFPIRSTLLPKIPVYSEGRKPRFKVTRLAGKIYTPVFITPFQPGYSRRKTLDIQARN
jgi:hypothetical protein